MDCENKLRSLVADFEKMEANLRSEEKGGEVNIPAQEIEQLIGRVNGLVKEIEGASQMQASLWGSTEKKPESMDSFKRLKASLHQLEGYREKKESESDSDTPPPIPG